MSVCPHCGHRLKGNVRSGTVDRIVEVVGASDVPMTYTEIAAAFPNVPKTRVGVYLGRAVSYGLLERICRGVYVGTTS